MYESFLKIFWDEVFVVGYSVFSIRPLSLESEASLKFNFTSWYFYSLLKRVSRDHGNGFSGS